MRRPDPSLLVPCTRLPRIPEGARLWAVSPTRLDLPFLWDRDSRHVLTREDVLLDASKPSLHALDLLPLWLDALPWLIAALVQRRRCGDLKLVMPDDMARAYVVTELCKEGL